MNNFFIDSTIWVDFFRGKNKADNAFITTLIDEDRVFYNDIILSELLIGAINSKEFDFLRSNFEGFNYLEADKTIFAKASQIGFKLRREGITAPLTDLIITAHAAIHNLTILTLDKHFKIIGTKIKLKLKMP
jgi:predicted nucleic acid-binding protein